VIQDLHGEGLVGHLRGEKNNIINVAFKRYRWPHLKLDIGNFMKKCYIYQTTKG